MNRRTDRATILTLIAMFAVAMVCWNCWLLYPIKVFVVLLHELGHGLAAVMTGGRIARIEISPHLGGACWSAGGWRFVVLPAGYLGSLLFGGLILVGAARTRHDRQIGIAIGILVVTVTVLFVRTAFGVVFGLLFGALMIAAGGVLPLRVNDLLLKFLGLTSALYAVIDIKEDLISRTVPGSDAYQMSREFLLPPVFWGALWIVIALAGTAFFVRWAARGDGRPAGR